MLPMFLRLLLTLCLPPCRSVVASLNCTVVKARARSVLTAPCIQYYSLIVELHCTTSIACLNDEMNASGLLTCHAGLLAIRSRDTPPVAVVGEEDLLVLRWWA